MAYVAYKQNDDGTYSFMDDAGQETPPMAGPAAQQQAAKLDAQGAESTPGMETPNDIAKRQGGMQPATPSTAPPMSPAIRGGPELSPDITEAAKAGPDQRMASNDHVKLGDSVIDAGGAPDPEAAKKAHLEKLIASGMTPREAVQYTKEQAAQAESWKAAGKWIKDKWEKLNAPGEEQRKQDRIAIGLPPEAPKPAGAEAGGVAAGGHGETGHAPANVAPGKVVMAGQGSSGRFDIPTVVPGAGAGPTRRVEMQTGRHVQEQKTVYGDEDQVAVKQAGQAQYNAVDDQALAEEAANNSLAAEKERQIGEMKDAEQQRVARESQRQEEAQKRLAEIDQLRQDVGSKIDPNQYWTEKTQGQKAAAALLMGIGAYVSAMNRGPNVPMEIFNQAVQQNIDAQKTNIQAKRGKLEDAKGAMAEFMRQGANEREAEHLTKLGILDDAQRRLDLTIAQTNNPKIKANAEAQKANIQAQYAKEQAEMNKTVVGQTKQYAMGTVGGAGNQKVIYDDVKKDQTVRGPDGKLYEFGEGATAQKAAERLGELNGQKQDAEKLQAILDNPTYILDPNKRAEANAIAKRIAIHAGKAEGSNGRINEGYFKAIEEAITNGDVNSLTNFGKSSAIKEYRSGLETEAQGIVAQHSVAQVKPFLLVNPQTGQRDIKFVRMGNAPKQAPSTLGAQVGE